MTPDTARSWIKLAQVQIEHVHGLGQQDPDLLATLSRVAGLDARLVARAAHPGDARAQERALEGLRGAYRPVFGTC
ncbi:MULTISPECIES: hypothetical protein [unclassified Actinomyces]|uniref:hypothetical protein n=1 Tax=unclassified Actinomyces TaxID=2609248 RepID=UPI002017FA63|nr:MULTISPECIES: hypothetical protein [unclassified Actinomyces]MCL3776918.1 hypothetical protein [Actinomyces sp. AC-20-1]MCL3789155.1 hypothetical protein [Actinomyces sp. 187325]MCL3792449.1 hypothetical protein [Actinomyces sp. 186855]MCL3794226.1 hypothetical protein [Actinomyces sp. 217892]